MYAMVQLYLFGINIPVDFEQEVPNMPWYLKQQMTRFVVRIRLNM